MAVSVTSKTFLLFFGIEVMSVQRGVMLCANCASLWQGKEKSRVQRVSGSHLGVGWWTRNAQRVRLALRQLCFFGSSWTRVGRRVKCVLREMPEIDLAN